MAAQVDDHRLPASVLCLHTALDRVVHGGGAAVTSVGQEAHVKAAAHRLDDAAQRVLLGPDLDVVVLPLPSVQPVSSCRGLEDCLRRAPVRGVDRSAGVVNDGFPVDVPAEAPVRDGLTQPLVPDLLVGDQVPGHQLVVHLAQSQPVALGLVLLDDGDVRHEEGPVNLRLGLPVREVFLHGCASRPSVCWTRIRLQTGQLTSPFWGGQSSGMTNPQMVTWLPSPVNSRWTAWM